MAEGSGWPPSRDRLPLCHHRVPPIQEEQKNQREVSNRHPDSKPFRKCACDSSLARDFWAPGVITLRRGDPLAVHSLGLLHPSPTSEALIHFQKQLAVSCCRYRSPRHPLQGDSHSHTTHQPWAPSRWVASTSEGTRQLLTPVGIPARQPAGLGDPPGAVGHSQSEETGPQLRLQAQVHMSRRRSGVWA